MPKPLYEPQTHCSTEIKLIRHIVFFTAKDKADLGRIVEGLELLGQIPHSEQFEVVRNSKVDLYGNDVDVIVYAEFADEAALAAYKAHPDYQRSIDLVRPIRDMRMAADYESDTAVNRPLR